jgi:Tfp pilus assembly protein PilX
MNKKGIALAVALWAVAVLSVIIASLFIKVINERQLVKRHASTVKSFWLAEAALSEGFINLPDSVSSTVVTQAEGCLPGAICSYQATVSLIPNSDPQHNYYKIDANGEVILPGGASLSTDLSATAQTEYPDASNFQHAIESNGDIIEKGSVEINGTQNPNAALNFSGLFTATKDEIKNNADHLYTEDNFAEPVDGITWVEVSSDQQLKTAGNLQGEGILIVNGDCHISGTENFNGIIYVIGGLTITGTVDINGAVLSGSETNIDTELKGNVAVTYDPSAISEALSNVGYSSKEIVAWQRIY